MFKFDFNWNSLYNLIGGYIHCIKQELTPSIGDKYVTGVAIDKVNRF